MNSNPFEPVAPEPAELKPTDNQPDNFAADSGGFGGSFENPTGDLGAKPARPSVMLDGITPNPAPLNDISSVPNAPNTGDNPIDDFGGMLKSKDDITNPHDPVDAANALPKNPENPLDGVSNDGEFLGNMAPKDDSKPIDKKAAKEAKKAGKLGMEQGVKPPKQFTISIASIILFILAAGGIGGTIYFYMQNNTNMDKLKTSQAQVEELKNNGADVSNSEDKTTNQFDALQNKITDLTKQNAEKQTTLDANKTKIDELTKKSDELTKKNDELTQKVQNISDLTTRVDAMLKKLEPTQ